MGRARPDKEWTTQTNLPSEFRFDSTTGPVPATSSHDQGIISATPDGARGDTESDNNFKRVSGDDVSGREVT
jgi:hypothetical protein